MRLYEIPKGSKIKAECKDNDGEIIGDTITFHHIDGMYSYCTVDGLEEKVEYSVVHLSANTPLKKVGDYYKIDE